MLVAVAYRRWSFTRGSNSGCNCKALTGKVVVFWTEWSLMGAGRLREVVAHGGSTVNKFRPKEGGNWEMEVLFAL